MKPYDGAYNWCVPIIRRGHEAGLSAAQISKMIQQATGLPFGSHEHYSGCEQVSPTSTMVHYILERMDGRPLAKEFPKQCPDIMPVPGYFRKNTPRPIDMGGQDGVWHTSYLTDEGLIIEYPGL